MKMAKRIVSVILAATMLFGCFSLAASANYEGKITLDVVFYKEVKETVDGAEVITWEPLTDWKVAEETNIRARIFADTNYAVGDNHFFFMYPTSFMTYSEDGLEPISAGSNTYVLPMSTNSDNPAVAGGWSYVAVSGTGTGIDDGPVFALTDDGTLWGEYYDPYVPASYFEGYGWVDIYTQTGKTAKTLSSGGEDKLVNPDKYYLFDLQFTVNKGATGEGFLRIPQGAFQTPDTDLSLVYMQKATTSSFALDLIPGAAAYYEWNTTANENGEMDYKSNSLTIASEEPPVEESYTVSFKAAADDEEALSEMTDLAKDYELTQDDLDIAAEDLDVPENKEFAYWTLTDGTKVEAGYKVTSDITLIPFYNDVAPATFSVSFEDADGEEVYALADLPEGTLLEDIDLEDAAAELAEVEGKHFTGWVIKGTETAVEAGYAVTTDLVLVPVYADNLYTVTYEDGKDGEISSTPDVKHGTEITAEDLEIAAEDLPAAEAGKAFAGWKIKGTDTVVEAGYAVKADLVLVPYYNDIKYTVTFYADEAGTTPFEVQTEAYTYEEALAYPATTPTAPEGMEFDKWSIAEGTAVTGNLSVTPIFKALTFKVEFQDAEGEVINTYDSIAWGTEFTAEDLAIEAEDLPEVEGQYFASWQVDGADVTAVTVKSNVVLTPRYEYNTYTVTFKDADGNEIGKVENVVYNTAVSADDVAAAEAKLPSLEGKGLKYTGWDGDTAAAIKADTVFTATTAKETYTVKFVTGVDGVTVADLPVAFDEDITAKLEQLNVEGLNFKGWVADLDTKAPAATKIADLGEDGATVTYYAYWTKTVTFVDGEAETTVEVDKDASILAKAPAFAGNGDDYEAGVWYDAANGAGNELTADAKATADAAATYYAYYAPKTGLVYTIVIYEEVLNKDGEYEIAETIEVKDGVAGADIVYNAARTGFKNPVLDPAGATVVASGAVAKVKYERIDDITITVDGETKDYEYGEELNPTAPETEDGQVFDKWVDKDGNEVKVPTTVTTDMDNLELIATYKYEITFIDQGATTKKDAQAEGAVIEAPAATGKADYTFAGWFTAENGAGTKLAADTVVTGVATYYAHYTAKTDISYSIEIYEEVLNKDGEYVQVDTVVVENATAGEAIVYNAAREGFKAPVLVPADAVVANGLVVKAYYDRIDDITITVDGETKDYEYGEELNPTAPETEDGQVFDKWVDKDGNEVKVPTTVTTDMDNLELIATYKYEITFIDQGVTTKNDAQAEGAVIEAPAATGKADYTFAGWFTAENGAGTKLAADTVVTGVATYYAHYTAKTDISYSIEIYEEVLNKDGEYVHVDTVLVENAKAGEAIVYNEARTGFKAPVLVPADAVVANGAVVKAYYDRIDDITITVDGETKDYEYGEKLDPTAPETEDGQVFDKWVDKDGNEVKVPTTVTTDMDNLELIPTYKYVITFIVNGETVKNDAQAESATIVAAGDPDIEGYAFGGWFTAENGAGEKLAADAKVTGAATYYAKLDAKKNTVVFKDKDGKVIETVKDVPYGTDLKDILPEAPEVPGQTFAGWVDAETGEPMPETMGDIAATYVPSYTGNGTTKYKVETYFMDADGNYTSKTVTESEGILGTKVSVEDKSDENVGYYLDTENSVMSADSLTAGTVLKAYYARKTVTVTFFDYDGITVLGEYTGLYGSKVEYPDEPTRAFHTFAGWSATPVTAPVADMTITATYDRVPVVLVNNKTTVEGKNVVFNRDNADMMYINGFYINDIKDADDYDRYLAVEGDGYFKVIPVANGKYGTGTKIELYDNYDGALLETYYIVIYGDVDGDANVTSNDISITRDEQLGKTSWSDPESIGENGQYDAIRTLAADLTGEGNVKNNDVAAITAQVNTTAEINQSTREVIYNS